MKKCLKITISAHAPDSLMADLQKKGTKLEIEGSLQHVVAENEIRVIACGNKDAVDQLVDYMHKLAAQAELSNVNIEPFVKTKDYRGAFRIIE